MASTHIARKTGVGWMENGSLMDIANVDIGIGIGISRTVKAQYEVGPRKQTG